MDIRSSRTANAHYVQSLPGSGQRDGQLCCVSVVVGRAVRYPLRVPALRGNESARLRGLTVSVTQAIA